VAFRDVSLEPARDGLQLRFHTAHAGLVGWQVFDPATGLFLSEGDWLTATPALPTQLTLRLPETPGRYRIFVSGRDDARGWHYAHGERFLVVDAEVDADGRARLLRHAMKTMRGLRLESLPASLARALAAPGRTLLRHAALIRSLVRRDLAARYRGSFFDAGWTLLQPLLLMATYYFVFAEVLQSRFPGDASREGFALYLLAGMIPWIALSEAIARAPGVLLAHRNLIQKLVFPSEVLPAQVTASALLTSLFSLAIFLVGLLILRHAIPATALYLPLIWIPQTLFTLGLCWMLAALGAYLRDLGHVMGFLLTLWFFLTPICYPDSALPAAALPVLGKNPAYILVRAYRAVMVEGHAPEWLALAKLTALGAALTVAGYAIFHKLKKGFADAL
jgi:lipopolysaccharide transport system permease protein